MANFLFILIILTVILPVSISLYKEQSKYLSTNQIKERSDMMKKPSNTSKKPIKKSSVARLTKLQKTWLDALKSGEYHQTYTFLAKKTNRWGYCCLGVACEVAIKEGIPLKVKKRGRRKCYGESEEQGVLPVELVEELHLRNDIGSFHVNGNGGALTEMNDDGKTFKEIANFILKHKKEVFTNF